MSHPVFEAVRHISAKEAAERAGLVLARKGPRFWTCCPLHGEKTASLMFNEDGSWHCFGCNKGGDAIQLYAEMYGLGNLDAAVQLAQNFGISVKENGRWIQPPPQKPTREDTKRKLFQWVDEKLRALRVEIQALDKVLKPFPCEDSTWKNTDFIAALEARSEVIAAESCLEKFRAEKDIIALADFFKAEREKEACVHDKTTTHRSA